MNTYLGTLIHEACIHCGGSFGLDQDHSAALHRNKGTPFHCTHCGKRMIYTGKTQLDLAREEAAAERARREMAEQSLAHARVRMERVERSRSAIRGVLTRTKKRVANGVCPCCQRHFTALERHMKTNHPDYKVRADTIQD